MVQAVLAGSGLAQLPTWLISDHLARARWCQYSISLQAPRCRSTPYGPVRAICSHACASS
ncbi:hypothetical protein [Sphingomonas sp. AP4-R1]|uniref:hypothetical protein n=1 Tax=Sphingomonas sp. AP4-R1 TaxID=2735134 RepID=UPI003462010B